MRIHDVGQVQERLSDSILQQVIKHGVCISPEPYSGARHGETPRTAARAGFQESAGQDRCSHGLKGHHHLLDVVVIHQQVIYTYKLLGNVKGQHVAQGTWSSDNAMSP